MSSGKFCVYEHWRPDKNVCFYVGKGTNKRAGSVIRRENKHHTRVVEKLKALGLQVEVRIFSRDLTEEDAFALEIARIQHWRDQADDLVNQTLGGEGASGNTHSVETRAKISLANKGRKKPYLLGVPHSEEHKAKISEGGKGRKVSEETRAKISAAQKGKFRPELIGRKISAEGLERMKNRVFTEEHRRKISKGNKGKVRTPEMLRKMSEASKLAWLKKKEEFAQCQS